MAESTGPTLAAGGITLANQTLIEDDADWNDAARIIVATGLVAGVLAMLERASPDLAVALSWATLATMMLTDLGGKPSPTRRILEWYNRAQE